jgi:hypothetical protein
MMTSARYRALALALPESEEKSHFGQPDFRVGNRIFASLSSNGTRGAFKVSRETQSMLLDARADVFTPASGAWGDSGWTHVDLARADPSEVRLLLVESFGLVAPKRLISSSDTGAASRPAAAPPRRKKAQRKKAAKVTVDRR